MTNEEVKKLDIGEVLAIDASIARSTNTEGFGITSSGFVPKPFARLLVEKLALARELFGENVDISSGSTIRKLLEISALEEARMWSALNTSYDNCFAVTATGAALSRIGEDLGIVRPFLLATGTVKLTLSGTLPSAYPSLTIPRGARMSTPGGHQVAVDESAVLSASQTSLTVKVVAFYPGPEHNLDPSKPNQVIDRWNKEDALLSTLVAAETAAGSDLVKIEHTVAMIGGELLMPDANYRQLILRAPKTIWSVEAIELAVSLVPGVRQVRVQDGVGGLDINQSIFGNFNFIERVFSAERDLGSPYYFSVLVAPTPAAIWDGPTGLQNAVLSAIEDLRPIGIFPNVESATEVGVGVRAKLIVDGIPLPSGSKATVNASSAAKELRSRIYARLRNYVDQLRFGEPVRAAEVIWSIMSEPGIVDVRDLAIVKYPAGLDTLDTANPISGTQVESITNGQNLTLDADQIAVFVDADDPSYLEIV